MRRFIFRINLLVVIIFVNLFDYLPAANPVELARFDRLPNLEVGDWVLRMGTDADSKLISHLSNGRFSHIGLIVQTKPNILVVHATTDDGESKSNQVIVSTLERFLSPELAKSGIIVRPFFLTSQEKNNIASSAVAQIGKPFALRSKEQAHLYCTTLLYEPIVKIYPQFKPEWKYISVPWFSGEYLFPQSFVGYPDTKTIYIHKNS